MSDKNKVDDWLQYLAKNVRSSDALAIREALVDAPQEIIDYLADEAWGTTVATITEVARDVATERILLEKL